MEKQEKELIDWETDIISLKLCTNDINVFFQTIKTYDVSTHKYETEVSEFQTIEMHGINLKLIKIWENKKNRTALYTCSKCPDKLSDVDIIQNCGERNWKLKLH